MSSISDGFPWMPPKLADVARSGMAEHLWLKQYRNEILKDRRLSYLSLTGAAV